MEVTKKTAKNPRGAGRPYTGGRERSTCIQVRLTQEEHHKLKALAKSHNSTASDLFRKMLVDLELPSEDSIPLMFRNTSGFISKEQAKVLYLQLSKILIGA